MPEKNAHHLLQACAQGNSEQLKSILASNPKAINTVLLKQTGALGIACANGHTECVRLLIEHGANVNKESNRLLLAHDADINLWDWAPLHHACAHGHAACVQLLLAHGAQVDALTEDSYGCDNQGKTPLHVACEGAESIGRSVADIEECIRLLVNHGGNVNAQDLSGETPLHYAFWSPKLIMALIELGADIAIRDRKGRTVLDKARINSSSYPKSDYCIKLLIQYGAR